MDHGDHEHDHTHRHHGHDHNHAHDHGHGMGDYFLEQLLTILVCGAFGVIGVLMWYLGRLEHMLAPEFHTWVMLGGIALLFFTVVRGLSLWVSVGAKEGDHAHGEDCNHGCDHKHDHPDHAAHDHGHGSIFWRMVVLAFPILLFCWGLPNSGFSADWVKHRLGKTESLATTAEVAAKGGDVLQFDFNELNASAFNPDKRAAYEGRTVRVKGQLQRVSDREYRFYKLKMTCCAADMIPLKARIRTKFVTGFQDGDWVTAEGILQFVATTDGKLFIPVIRVEDPAGLTKTKPE